MALARMPPQHFPSRRNLKALGRASVRLQFRFLVLLHNSLFAFLGLAARGGLRRSRRLRRGCALFGRQQRQQDIRFHPWPEFYQSVIVDVFEQPFHLGAAHTLVSHLAPAVENHRLYFVTFAQKPDDLVLAHLIIVLRSRGPKLYFLDVRTFLVLLGFVRLLALLVEKLSVIHELADRGHGAGRNFHQVETRLARCFHRVEQRHHTQLAARIIHYAYFTSANALIDPKAGTSTTLGDKPTSRTDPINLPPDLPVALNT